MKSLFKKHSSPESHYQHRALCGVNYPHPAIEHGWLHGRELKLGWNIERIAARIGERSWLSYYETDQSAGQGDQQKQRLTALAGYWPSGGFIELLLHNINALEEHPRGVLAVYASRSLRSRPYRASSWIFSTGPACPTGPVAGWSCFSITAMA